MKRVTNIFHHFIKNDNWYNFFSRVIVVLSPYISAWNNWPGGVIASIVVHNESDAAIDTWGLSVKFNQVSSYYFVGIKNKYLLPESKKSSESPFS